jgi:hypothetical protein
MTIIRFLPGTGIFLITTISRLTWGVNLASSAIHTGVLSLRVKHPEHEAKHSPLTIDKTKNE